MGTETNTKKKFQIKGGAILGYVNYFIKMLIQLIYVPIMLRLLGQNEYGVYQLVASLISYLSLLDFGFGGAYLRFYAQCKSDKRKEAELNGTFMIVFIFFSILVMILGSIITINSDLILGNRLTKEELSLAKTLIALLTVNMVITFPISVFSSIITSRECFIFQRIVELVKTILNPFLVVTLLILGYGSVGMVVVTTFLTVLGALLNIWYVFKIIKAPFMFGKINKNLIKRISTFSFFLFLNSVIDQINWNVDNYLLGRFVGSVAIAIYSIGAQINTIYIQITDMLATVLAPRVNSIVANEKEPMRPLNRLFIMVGRLQCFIVCAVVFGFITFGYEFIELWAGKGYEEAYMVTLLLIIPVSIPLCQTLGVDIQRALNKHKYRSLVYVCIAFGNLFISIPLIKYMGAIGAALGTAISLIIGNGIVMNIIYQKLIGLNILRFWKEIIRVIPWVIIPFVCSMIIKYIVPINSILVLIWQIFIFIIIYCVFMIFFAMNKEEKYEIFKFIEKVRRK